ncbi:methionine adenosyltransferase domain-containing protein [Candidatus Falkowbacteria bacterium]|jgi:S-adenosylmethionine synthetase|nr:methionine adenosyltransferase domain-containing protein [Candidatus Falkowbacteria bacterium]MBT5502822.1 methionine adenosyltransferase domain-containing protein [Candidatus Falkowbacteria bacterium]MBT6573407.1 methionine adenosyltransferase domain-containing protein [Candidatus Falkowbacteria bacterium]MBT7348449.1 methionine adenosyltransferase domain-containing protein [Candidatus Falkowbacteria bacterium]MBT7501207.1 methionine adenosyltransferase domain-containing protein [Candidatus
MLRTAESVSPMHPDKICDRVSDAILDICLSQDPHSRVAVETMGGHGVITITGEITSGAVFDAEKIAKRIAGDQYQVSVNLVQQSPDIARGVDPGGAGDQGIMVGYACSETPELIPLEVKLSRDLCRVLFSKYKTDGKTQITLENNLISTVVASFQHARAEEMKGLVEEWLKDKNVSENLKIYVNPAGDWSQGGFEADAGVTGRKLIVDNYGPRIPIGGGAFSGKDPSKVDRSAAYMARKIAVDYLQKNNAKEVICHLAYSIGVAEPVMATVEIDGRKENVQGYDLTPKGIITLLELKKPQFEQTAEFGHFGNNFCWDK